MIIKEFYRIRVDGVNLYKIYSDKKVYIQKEGSDFCYTTVIDVENAPFVYVETDKPIPEKPVDFRIRRPAEVVSDAEQNN